MSKGSIKITSQEEFFKALKKDSVRVAFGKIYMGDRHKRTLNSNLLTSFNRMGVIEPGNGAAEWFERGFRLKGRYRKCKTFADFKDLVKADKAWQKRMTEYAVKHNDKFQESQYRLLCTHTCVRCRHGFTDSDAHEFGCCPHCSEPGWQLPLRKLTPDESHE